MRDTVTTTKNAWNHAADVQFDLAPDLPLVYGLPHKVSQVFLHVIRNAAHAVEGRVGRKPRMFGRHGRRGLGSYGREAENPFR